MKQQIVAVIGAISLSLGLAIGLQRGVISMTDVSAWLAPAVLSGIIAFLVWGFRDQIEATFKGKTKPQKVEVTNFPFKMQVYSPIHAMIVRVNNEIPRETAHKMTVGAWVSASLIDSRKISEAFDQHSSEFRDEDLKMWIEIEKEIKSRNGFFLGQDRQKWFMD
jgi:hypothetical protein